MLAQLFLVSVLFHVLHSMLTKIRAGKKTRDVSVTNIKGDRTALDYKLE